MGWRNCGWCLVLIFGSLCLAGTACSQSGLNIGINQTSGPLGLQVQVSSPSSPDQLSGLLKIFLILTVVTLAPSILIMCTSFTRIVIVLSFLRHAMGITSIPPNQILIALALFLTAFNMMPVWTDIQAQAVKPYAAGRISWEEAAQKGLQPIRYFMLKQTRPKDLSLMIRLSQKTQVRQAQDVPLLVLLPAFILSELRAGFQIGFLLYLPFLVIDMVVASILLSMGMMMLPPVMISLPFKILLFVMVDGWNLLAFSLLRSFR